MLLIKHWKQPIPAGRRRRRRREKKKKEKEIYSRIWHDISQRVS